MEIGMNSFLIKTKHSTTFEHQKEHFQLERSGRQLTKPDFAPLVLFTSVTDDSITLDSKKKSHLDITGVPGTWWVMRSGTLTPDQD